LSTVGSISSTTKCWLILRRPADPRLRLIVRSAHQDQDEGYVDDVKCPGKAARRKLFICSRELGRPQQLHSSVVLRPLAPRCLQTPVFGARRSKPSEASTSATRGPPCESERDRQHDGQGRQIHSIVLRPVLKIVLITVGVHNIDYNRKFGLRHIETPQFSDSFRRSQQFAPGYVIFLLPIERRVYLGAWEGLVLRRWTVIRGPHRLWWRWS